MLLSLLTFLFSLLSFPPFSPPGVSRKRSLERVRILPPLDECVWELGHQCLQGLNEDVDPSIRGCREVWLMSVLTRNFIALTSIYYLYIILPLCIYNPSHMVLHVYTQSSRPPTRQDHCLQLTSEETTPGEISQLSESHTALW